MYFQNESDEYRFYYEDGFEKFEKIFRDYLENKIKKTELQRNKYSIVYKIEVNEEVYILKEFIDNPKEKIKFWIKNKIFKTNARRLFLKTKEMENKDFINLCTCYFAAEKNNSKRIRSFIIMEFIDGVEVDNIKNKTYLLKENLYLNLRLLHKKGIVSGDPNPTNFFVTKKNEIKLIDITAKKATFFRIINDIERFNRDFETEFGDDFWGWKYYRYFIKK